MKPTPNQRRRRMVYESMLAATDLVTENIGEKIPAQKPGTAPPANVLQLIELLGARPTALLLKHFGGGYLPTYLTLVKYLRQECIRHDIERGMTNRALLAAKYQIPVSTVDKIITETNKARQRQLAEQLAKVTDPEEPLVCRIEPGEQE